MEPKKTNKADLLNKKSIFFEIGLAVSLVLVLMAFNWKSQVRDKAPVFNYTTMYIDDENVPVTIDKPEPVEVPKVNFVPDKILIADNLGEFDINVSMFNAEVDKFGISPRDYVVWVTDNKERPDEKEVTETIPIAAVHEEPIFMGNSAKQFPAWVQKQIVYPQVAADMGIEGTVYLQFTITAKGGISNIKVLRSIDPLLEEEAIRVVKESSSGWKAGRHYGKPVAVSFQFPVIFRLSK